MTTLYTIGTVIVLYLLLRIMFMFWSCGGPTFKLFGLDTGIADCLKCKEESYNMTHRIYNYKYTSRCDPPITKENQI